jgi:iron complex transport system substrate-binding protein
VEVLETTTEFRRIRHGLGEVQVPLVPQRVLALGEDELLLNLLDLGVKPIGANVNLPERVALATPDELAGITLLPSAGDITIETLAALQPDLIIGTRFFVEGAGYDALSAIAPTVVLGSGDSLGSYQETAAVFGKSASAQQAVTAFRQRMHAESTRVGANQRMLSLASVYPGPNVAVWVDGPSPVPTLVRAMGISLSPDSAAVANLGLRNGRAFISPEQLTMLTGSTIVLLQSDTVEGEQDAVQAIAANPLWQTLPAVKTGRVVTLDRLGYPGLRGQQQLLDELVKLLES